MVHHTNREALEPFAAFWAFARDPSKQPWCPEFVRVADLQAHGFYTALVERMTQREVDKLARACAAHTTTNCWYAAYRVIRDPEFLKVLNAEGVKLHWANDECHVPGVKACKPFGCEVGGAVAAPESPNRKGGA